MGRGSTSHRILRAGKRVRRAGGRITRGKRPNGFRSTGRRKGRRIFIRVLLSKREQEVLNWLNRGKTSWGIAMILNITERTVNYHVSNIMQKLDVSSRAHAVSEATGRGLDEKS